MHREFMNRARSGRTYDGTVHLILSRELSFISSPSFASASRRSRMRRTGSLLGLQSLQRRFADLGAGLGDLRGELTVNSIKMGRLAL